jgi:hypothetical protein
LAPPRIASARRPARLLATVGAVSALTVGLAACGDSSSGSGSTSTTGQQANARQGLFSDPKVQACLKKAGVDVPDFRRGNGQPPSGSDGQPPSGGNGQPPSGGNGQPPSGQQPPNGGFRNSAQGEKIRKALQKCGVTLPNRGQNGPPEQQQDATPSDTTAS